jgi:hypothetical protein
MRRVLFLGAPALLAAAVLTFTFGGRLPAHHPEHDGPSGKAIADSLRTVINQGADLYNLNRDYLGCYRLYQGSLLTLRPILDGHPDLQKAIDRGIADAERIPINWQKAFALRSVIDDIRSKLGGKGGEPATDKKPADDVKKLDDKKIPVDDKKIPTDDKKIPVDDKKVPADDKKSDGKKPDGKKADDKSKPDVNRPNPATVTGKVTFKGQPLNSGFVTFIGRDNRRYSANISADGTFSFRKGIPAGDYAVIIDPAVFNDPKAPAPVAIPDQFRNPDRTTLIQSLKQGANTADINLQ